MATIKQGYGGRENIVMNKTHCPNNLNHRYIIPVEWKFYGRTGEVGAFYEPNTQTVTRLRCECGEEIQR